MIQVEITDRGKGIPPDKQQSFFSGGAMGVGLRGMRERVAQLGGRMDLRSGNSGTTVIAVLPLSAASNASAAAASAG